jgi:hypothetical protein
MFRVVFVPRLGFAFVKRSGLTCLPDDDNEKRKKGKTSTRCARGAAHVFFRGSVGVTATLSR